MFARARRIVDSLAAARAELEQAGELKDAPVVHLLASDEPSLSCLEVAFELGSSVAEVFALQAPSRLAAGPLTAFLDLNAADPEQTYQRTCAELRAACSERIEALAAQGDATSELVYAAAHDAWAAARYFPAEVAKLRSSVDAVAATLAEAIERADPALRAQIYARATRARGRGAGPICDLVEVIDGLLLREPGEEGWSPSHAQRRTGAALRGELVKAMKHPKEGARAPHHGVHVYLPVKAADEVEPAFLGFGLLREEGSARPSQWARMLGALRDADPGLVLDARGRSAAAAEVRMRQDMSSFWVRGSTRAPEEDSRAQGSIPRRTGPRAQWGVLTFGTGGDNGAQDTRGQRVSVKRYGRDDPFSAATLTDLIVDGARAVHAHRLCLVIRQRGSASKAPSRLGETKQFALPRFCTNLDGGSGLTIPEFAAAVKRALEELGRERLDLLVIDMNDVVSVELAYELKDVARRLVSASDLANLEGVAHRGIDPEGFVSRLDEVMDPERGGPLAAILEDLEARAAAAGDDEEREQLAREFEDDALELATDALVRSREDPKLVPLVLDLEQSDRLTRRLDALCKQLFNHLDNPSVWVWLNTILDGYHRTYGALWPLCALLDRMKSEHLGAFYARRRGEPTEFDENTERYEPLDVAYPLDPDPSYLEVIDGLDRATTRAIDALEDFTGKTGPSGLLAYFPRGDEGMNDESYLRLAYHHNVHMYALLSAVRLLKGPEPKVGEEPRVHKAHRLWDIVSKAIAYTRGRERSALLKRLAFHEADASRVAQTAAHRTQLAQFASLASPPMITLSIEPDSPYGHTDTAHSLYAEGEGDTRYRVRLSSNQAHATLPQAVRRVNPTAIDEALGGLDMLLRTRRATDAEWNYLASIGASLGEDIIGDLKDPLDALRRDLEREQPGRPVHLSLRVPRELMRYPWELMVDGTGMLASRYAVGRQVWTESGRALKPEERDTDPLRVLIVGDPALDPGSPAGAQLPGARAEAEEVAARFEALDQEYGAAMDFRRERDVFIHKTVTRAAMRRLLRDRGYDIVHFAGHGVFNPGHPERSAWLMSDGPLWASELRNTLAWSRSPPWLIYANACEAGMSRAQESSRYSGDVFGLATACINQGVKAYVAPLWQISEVAGKSMAVAFYEELLLRSATLGVALQSARARTQQACRARPGVFGLVDISWASVVLYGDPAARLSDTLDGGGV
ncbi:MAG: CHAT domain-containing protein [Myxococcales bacterium]|nr:CHAT domain-containing protein [Myxococcales bacterium]